MKPTQRLHLQRRGLPLVAHAWGPEDAAVVLCLHGFLDHGESFAALAGQLAGPWRVVAPDARGHGWSGWVGSGGNYYFPDYYHDTLGWLEALGAGGGRPVHVVGHSMGGMIACGVAALRPQWLQRVVLLDGLGPPERPVATARNLLAAWADALDQPACQGDVAARRRSRRPMADVASAAQRLISVNHRLSHHMALQLAASSTEAVAAEETDSGAAGVVWRHDPLHRVPSARPFRSDEAMPIWQAMTMPVLAIGAGQSEWRLPDRDQRLAALPDVTWRMIDDAGHNLHHEQPLKLAGWLDPWLRNGIA